MRGTSPPTTLRNMSRRCSRRAVIAPSEAINNTQAKHSGIGRQALPLTTFTTDLQAAELLDDLNGDNQACAACLITRPTPRSCDLHGRLKEREEDTL